jgi:hypothetical protein
MSSLGAINSEDCDKDAQLFQMPMPVSPSTEAILMDLFGALRTIKIKGTYTGSTVEISAFIVELDALVNGTQTQKTYHSDKTGVDYLVLVQNARWSAEEGAPNKVDYEIVMIEGNAL